MANITLGASVECTDGLAGEASSVIVDPGTKRITHFVVKEKSSPHTERLVLAEHVVKTAAGTVRLDVTRDELSKMEPFVYTEYRDVNLPRYVGDYGYTKKEAPPREVRRERVPEGERAVRKGFEVQATDGKVGRIDELVIDAESGEITHLVMREGHLWGQKEIVVSVADIDYSDEEAVYLTLDKATISSHLAIPVRERHGVANIELVVLTVDEAQTAEVALKALKPLAKNDVGAVLNAAVLEKDEQGKGSLKEMDDVDRRHGALFGAITGGLIGLVGGPAGVIVGAAAGAVTGGVAAGLIDMGFPDDYLKSLQDGLQPGTAAVVVLVNAEQIDMVTEALAGYEGQLLRQTLTDEMVQGLSAGTEEEENV